MSDQVTASPTVTPSPVLPGANAAEQEWANHVVLSERDAEQVLRDAANPPAPTAAAQEAAQRFTRLCGDVLPSAG